MHCFWQGCLVLSFGAYLQLVGDVVMLSGDALIRAVAKVTGKAYADLRVVNDVALTAISAVLSLIFLHGLVGVREGTVIAAFLVGFLVKCHMRRLAPLTRKLMP